MSSDEESETEQGADEEESETEQGAEGEEEEEEIEEGGEEEGDIVEDANLYERLLGWYAHVTKNPEPDVPEMIRAIDDALTRAVSSKAGDISTASTTRVGWYRGGTLERVELEKVKGENAAYLKRGYQPCLAVLLALFAAVCSVRFPGRENCKRFLDTIPENSLLSARPGKDVYDAFKKLLVEQPESGVTLQEAWPAYRESLLDAVNGVLGTDEE